jgi:ABC-type Fe3+ transport system substrate-binding protein
MIRQLIMGALAAALAVNGSAYGAGADGKGKKWDDLVKAAQREGEISLILFAGLSLHKGGVQAFEEKYGIKVNYQTGSSRQHAERILAERRLGRYTVDAWIGGANTALSKLIPNGVLQPITPLLVDPEVKDPSNWFQGKLHYVDPEGRYILAWGASPSYTVHYNTELVDPNEIKSYADLLDPKWKGKIVSMSPGQQGSGGSSVPMYLNPKIGEEWFRRWANEMDVTIVDDARQGAEWLALGRFAIGMFGLSDAVEELKDQGFPVKDYLPHPMQEGEVLTSSANNLMAVDKAPHPNALKLFVNWALGQEAQQLFIKLGERKDSLRRDVDNSVIAPQYRIQRNADYYIAFEDPAYQTRQTEILNRLRQILREAGYK